MHWYDWVLTALSLAAQLIALGAAIEATAGGALVAEYALWIGKVIGLIESEVTLGKDIAKLEAELKKEASA